MKSKPIVIVVSFLVALILLVGACSAGFVAGQVFSPSLASTSVLAPFLPKPESQQIPTPASQAESNQDLAELFVPFWQAWDLVKERYVDQPVDEEAMMRGAIRGMLESLGDEHTSYLDPEMFGLTNAHLQGQEYEGIGAWVDTGGDYLTIISPMPGSPAEKAGLRPNDKIIAIDGEDMTGVDGEVARQKVLGPEGSVVILTVQREGVEPFDVEVTRAAIVVPSVDAKMLDNNIGYVRLYTFGDKTADDLHAALEDLMAEKPAGLVLDLRNNGGGYLDTAIEVVSEFVSDGVVMFEEYGDGSRVPFDAKKGGLATKIPIVVLVNEGTASASEIVAGAIQDRDRGQLVGTTSFGKGSVQTIQELANLQGAVRVTIARWLTPDGRQINGVGLEPDFVIVLTEEDLAAGLDPQLQKAIELLLGK
jgi:carboxyl-terminal processing protease